MLAIWLGDHAIRADRPPFSLVQHRPTARRRRQRWRRNRTSARVSRRTSVICSAALTARGKNRKHARNGPTKCRLGTVASLVCPVAVFILERRRPMAAQQLGDVAVSAESPSLFPRRHRPLGRTSVTSATKLSESLRRRRRRCGAPRRPSRIRGNKTDARALSRSSRHYHLS